MELHTMWWVLWFPESSEVTRFFATIHNGRMVNLRCGVSGCRQIGLKSIVIYNLYNLNDFEGVIFSHFPHLTPPFKIIWSDIKVSFTAGKLWKKEASIAIANLKNHLVVVPGAKQLSTMINEWCDTKWIHMPKKNMIQLTVSKPYPKDKRFGMFLQLGSSPSPSSSVSSTSKQRCPWTPPY